MLCFWNGGEELAFDPDGEAHEQCFVPLKQNCSESSQCPFDTREQRVVKNTRSNFKFYAASVGFSASCLRKWQQGAVLLVLYVTSGHFMVCALPFLYLHYWLISKKLWFPETGLGLKWWEWVLSSRCTFMTGQLHRWKHGLRPLHRTCKALSYFTLSESFAYRMWVMLPHQTYFDATSGPLLPNTDRPVLGTIWIWNNDVVPGSKQLTRTVREMAEQCRLPRRCKEIQWALPFSPTGRRGCGGTFGFSISQEGLGASWQGFSPSMLGSARAQQRGSRKLVVAVVKPPWLGERAQLCMY